MNVIMHLVEIIVFARIQLEVLFVRAKKITPVTQLKDAMVIYFFELNSSKSLCFSLLRYQRM